MDRELSVKYGSIYTKRGICIDNMAVIYDTEIGCLLKCGDLDKSIRGYYDKIITRYNEMGFIHEARSINLIRFDRYEGCLSVEEICTFVNYMLMCTSIKDTVNAMLLMGEEELKRKLNKLAEIGY